MKEEKDVLTELTVVLLPSQYLRRLRKKGLTAHVVFHDSSSGANLVLFQDLLKNHLVFLIQVRSLCDSLRPHLYSVNHIQIFQSNHTSIVDKRQTRHEVIDRDQETQRVCTKYI